MTEDRRRVESDNLGSMYEWVECYDHGDWCGYLVAGHVTDMVHFVAMIESEEGQTPLDNVLRERGIDGIYDILNTTKQGYVHGLLACDDDDEGHQHTPSCYAHVFTKEPNDTSTPVTYFSIYELPKSEQEQPDAN